MPTTSCNILIVYTFETFVLVSFYWYMFSILGERSEDSTMA